MIFKIPIFSYSEHDCINRLYNALCCLPGVTGLDVYNEIDYSNKFGIFLNDSYISNEILFFLGRCIDRRYWEYGSEWRIELVISDNPERPISWFLNTNCEDINSLEKQIDSLIENMVRHLNNTNFLSGFNINKDDFLNKQQYEIRNHNLKQII